MEKVYDHKLVEDKIYQAWEEKGYFKPENRFGNTGNFSIILPPPNANAPLHFGHAMYVIEDILVRYNRMQGKKTLWLPGADHAGFETQFVFEKKLQAEEKSRFDYDRETLYKMIWEFVHGNRPVMENQLKRLGFSLDWSKKKFTLDPDIVKIVYKTFKKLHEDELLYRAKRLVNYCTFDGTSFSDLEVITQESQGTLYEISYPVVGGGEIIVATSRPETLYGDAAVMVHPEDTRYKNLIGKTVMLPLTNREIPIVADEFVKKEFGTGAVKVTPLHNFDDWEVGQRHGVEGLQVIGFDGKMMNTNVVDGMYVKPARAKTLELLKEKGFLKEEEQYDSTKGICYKCKNVLEPLPLEQWFIKMEPLAKKAIDVVKKGDVKIHPENFDKLYFQFLENIRDWNISRQVVWGIRIPVWFKVSERESVIAVSFVDAAGRFHPMQPIRQALEEGSSFEEIEKGLQRISVLEEFSPAYQPEMKISETKPINGQWLQETDTFDTWFSSGQWPFATLQSLGEESFYPTTVMETGYDILRWWVARMVMLGIYATGKVPFEHVVLHGLVNDPLGKKMSKSKGNVVNPMELVDEYGADSIRFALVYGTALGNDQVLSYPKLEAMKRFSNKLWNIARFIEMNRVQSSEFKIQNLDEALSFAKSETDKDWVEKTNQLVGEVTKQLDSYQFNLAAEKLYEFTWHQFADIYIEDVKNRIDENSYTILYSLFTILLTLLHPFIPFITEEIYGKFQKDEALIISPWPTV